MILSRNFSCWFGCCLVALVWLTGCSAQSSQTSQSPQTSTEPSATIQQSAVAMPDAYSAQVATDILRAGGNAVDAAVATAFTLAVTFPEAGNIGGGGFMLMRMNGQTDFLDYREVAPSSADRDMYLGADGEFIPRSSLTGHRASGVPGTVAGMWAAHARFGILPWADLLAAPIRLAQEGFVIHENLVANYRYAIKLHAGKTNFQAHFGAMQVGSVLRQPALAKTLQRIADSGRDGFYLGETARLLVAEMDRGNGLISAQDLQQYRAIWRQPLVAQWRNFEVHAAPPPSSGGVALLQLLKMKDLLSREFAGVSHNTTRYVHLIAEIEKRVFADRAKYMGDPEFTDVPHEELIDDVYLARRAAEVNPTAISPTQSVEPGLESMHTTHYSIIDRWGNAIANTYTINVGFGSGVVVKDAGFLLNNEMDDFSAKPGTPNAFGVVGATANEIQPGKRMLSSMTPTILLSDDQVRVVVGSPGGSTIITSVMQTILNLLDFDHTPQEAVDAPRFHHQLLPKDQIRMSLALPAATQQALHSMGYTTTESTYGDVQLIWQDGRHLAAASDARGRGSSLVIEH